ncbi:MAG: YcaO-like family protein [Acidobacteriota bacterium]
MAGFIHHRDASPEETVARLGELLSGVGIALSEVGWCDGIDGARSLAVLPSAFLKAHPSPSANGKGTNTELARASAYAEFIERLQNTTRQTPVLLPRRFGLMEPELADPPDACTRTLGELLDHGSAAAKDLLRLYDVHGPDARKSEAVCFPFFNATTGEAQLLPMRLLYKACLSNGMAAGNTPEEALVHALCEIFERFAVTRAYREQLRLPTIAHEHLAGLRVHTALERLMADGLRVIVKDCSFGGVYPVVALILYDPSRNRYGLRFGSDPILDIALERCVVEICQGVNYKDLRDEMLDVLWDADEAGQSLRLQDQPAYALERFIMDGDAQFASSIFISAGEPRHQQAFADGEIDNRRLLRRLHRVLRQEGYQLLVRDVSYLGFPAYYVYVPRMSDAHASKLSLPGSQSWEPHRLLARLADASDAEIAEWLEVAEREVAGHDAWSWARDYDSLWWFGLMVDNASGLSRLYYSDVLFAELACRIGRYDRAGVFLGRHLEKARRNVHMEIKNPDYSWCTLATLKLRARGASQAEEAATLADLFGQRRAAEVREDLHSLGRPLADSMLPRCGDCSRCALRPHCYFPFYSALVGELNHRMADIRIDQSRLAGVLRD